MERSRPRRGLLDDEAGELGELAELVDEVEEVVGSQSPAFGVMPPGEHPNL